MKRRLLLQSLAGATLCGAAVGEPFPWGVASGDPWPDGVVLWTRTVMPGTVRWEVAEDEAFARVVQEGSVKAEAVHAHAVHVTVRGLKAGRWYWYRFMAAAGKSEVGRTKTAPGSGETPERLRIAYISCQKYEDGYFTALEHLAEEDVDLVLHLGDYIYEGACGKNKVRTHPYPTAANLGDYRQRYELYKSDAALRKLHARFPFAVIPDDHEVADDYAGLIPDWDSPADVFPQRRRDAYQAYWEHMPLRGAGPRGLEMPMYRTLRYGQLAHLHMLDTRQYRTDQPCGGKKAPNCPERERPERTMLGLGQERWLEGQLRGGGRWNVMAQQVVFATLDLDPGLGESYPMDKWDGCPAARERLLAFLQAGRVANPVVLTGDNHNNWVFDLRPKSGELVATEFVGTSVTSNLDGAEVSEEYGPALGAPHIRWHNSQRGYVVCELTPKQWTTRFRVVPYVTRPGSGVMTKATFVIEAGRPGAVKM
ncbi:MAG: alkaline phosphatase D family protein [Acidobacteria bacterium]|nr:alkaline phosphatase D family protein [Acidobacteriota bacterium]